ncbi:homoserine kinase [Candidatus Frackibacter sp. WG12]|nr:MAG: homoserine kinase [Candidatus Frackibacter sp. T328-2]SDC60103.1 homoserine kinase [Candidatus Frackibacter sp. WG11]SEM41837.1 homoserine kinase [Candidatus Frackibacter sp. WG12]SFL84450.1 homoserine kinase [Candidatus Frackibacter sp. WG13]
MLQKKQVVAMHRVKVPATTANLGPGFDILGMALNFHNIIEAEEIEEGLEIEVEGLGQEELPDNEENLVYQAMEYLFSKTDYSPTGLSIKLINQVPLSRGLGSSATVIVGGLVLANHLAGGPFSKDQILNFAIDIEGHPDNVAPALLGGVVISVMPEGKEVIYKKLDAPELKTVVGIPDFKLSTTEAREVLPAQVTFNDAIFNCSRIALLIGALMSKDYELLATCFEDRLHQSYRQDLVPGMESVIKRTKDAGALAVALSGAGPSIVALTLDAEEKVGQTMVQTFAQHGIAADYRITEPAVDGVIIEK